MQADEVQARLRRADAFLMYWPMLAVDGQVDPIERGQVAGAPDNVCHLEDPSVVEEWQTIADANRAADPLDACGCEVLG